MNTTQTGYTESPEKIAERAQRRLRDEIVHDCQGQMDEFIGCVVWAMDDPLGVMFVAMVEDDRLDAERTQEDARGVGLQ